MGYRMSLKQERSEYGKRCRKEYERGSRIFGGRSAMKQYVPCMNGKCETVTTVEKDTLVMEVWEVEAGTAEGAGASAVEMRGER